MTISSRKVRTLLAALAAVLPRRLRRFVHVRLLGYRIDPTASVGHAFIDVDRANIGAHATIGHLNAIRGLEDLHMGAHAHIAHLNWVNAVRRDKGFFEGVDRHLALVLGYNAGITVMHFVDCCARVTLEDRAVIAGYWTQVMTHSFDYRTNRQTAKPITIGERSVVTTRCTVLPGVKVADRCIVAAGSVVHGSLRKPGFLYAGSPARPLKELGPVELFSSEDTMVR